MRELCLKSGNLCAFPDCDARMIDATGTFVGQVCHIEAAEERGERFNPAMTNEQRRHFSNLMLMCYPHHQTTNDVAAYPVDRLQSMKAEHEKRFTDPRAAQNALNEMKDWTVDVAPTTAHTLGRLSKAMNWTPSVDEVTFCVNSLNKYAERFQRVPQQLRLFVGLVAERIHRLSGTRAAVHTSDRGSKILVSDLQGSLRVTEDRIWALGGQLDSYRLGSMDEMTTDVGEKPAVLVRDVDGWDLWVDIARFCAKTGVKMQTFTLDLDFGSLD